MTINWFPGHMNKARRELAARFKKSDLVIELLDARVPRASENPMLARLRGTLPCLKLLTKSDLADPEVTRAWKQALKTDRVLAEDVTSGDPKLGARIAQSSRKLVPHRGHPGFPVRVAIVGIPNVGKSTLFNTLMGARKAEVRDKPAVTRREQQGQVSEQLFIVDTPGVLWPKLANQRAAHCLAAIGSVGEAAFDPVEVAVFAVGLLRERYADALKRRFQLETADLDLEALTLLELIGKKRGCLLKGAAIDLPKAAGIVLQDLRNARIDRVSLERPDDYPAPHSEPLASSETPETQ